MHTFINKVFKYSYLYRVFLLCMHIFKKVLIYSYFYCVLLLCMHTFIKEVFIHSGMYFFSVCTCARVCTHTHTYLCASTSRGI